jgi:hypothetical protein
LTALVANLHARDSRSADGAMTALASLVLTLMLATTTPAGTGAGIHQFDLLHTLFPHVHVINGYVVLHNQVSEAGPPQAMPAAPRNGIALGAGSGGDAGGRTLGLSPTVPANGVRLSSAAPAWHDTVELPAPQGCVDTPPDPPPTRAA